MQPESSQQPESNNESNLLQSNVEPEDRPLPSISTNSFDEVPIGGGSKFQFSEFPEEGDAPKVVKKVVKTLKAKKPVIKKTPVPEEASQKPDGTLDRKEDKENNKVPNSNTPVDEIPLNKPSIKPSTFDDAPIGSKKNFDEMAIGGKKNFDDAPTGGKMDFDQKPIGGGGKMNFDEAPVGKTNFVIPEFAEGQQPQEATETEFPMDKKLASKMPKLRLSGLQDLFALLTEDPNSPEISDIQILRLMKETNPACLEKMLQCFKAWIQSNKDWGDDQARSAIENGFINGKANTKKLTIEICDLMFQEKPDLFERTIITGLKGKVPKFMQGYITVLMEILTIFGVKKLKFLKPYMIEIARILNNEKNPALKTQGMNLFKQAYKWMGKETADAFLTSLKQNFKKDLDTFWEGYDQSIQMSAPKDIAEPTTSNSKGGNKKMDAYEISDAHDIFKKFNEKWSESVLKAEKWNQKTRLMQELIGAANVPKIAPNDFRHITDMIKRLINDSNFNVVLMDLKIIAALAKGIRRPFAPFARSIFLSIISKFRDKKTQMIDETFHTLNQLQYCVSIQDVLDDVKQGLGDKAPNMKVNLVNWIGKFIEKKTEEKGQLSDKAIDAVRSLFPIFEKLLQDSILDVRNCMVNNIAKMKMLLGDHFFQKIENKMSKNQVGKMQDSKENTKTMGPKSKDKPLQKDLSKSHLTVSGKDHSKMSRTINLSSKNLQEDESAQRKGFSEIGGKIDLTSEIQQLLPKMNDQKNWEKRKQAAETLINWINDYSPKVSINNPADLLATLKVRNNDTNRQLIKVFIHLTGLVFSVISDREAKLGAKNFICQLSEGLSDKNETNRKEMVLALNRIGDAVGKDILLATLGQYLEGNSQARVEIINIILMNQEYLTKSAVRDYPKGMTSCLCDKNRQIRNAAERLLERVVDLSGFDVFRNLASQQRPAYTKDLNAILDRLEKGNTLNTSTLMSKGVSPIRTSEKRNPPTSASARKTQKSLSKINKSFDREIEITEDLMMTTVGKRSLVQGDDFFAPIKILTGQRIERQQLQQRIPWKTDDLKQPQQEQICDQLSRLINPDISSKMLSYDYRKVMTSVLQIIKACKDINQQGHIRQMHDLLMKWILLRLWGGNPALFNMIEVLPPVMSILEKKKLVLNDSDVQVVIAIIREYFISAFMNDSKVSQNLYTITKCLISLSSGDRVLKKILRQFSTELGSIHRHVRKEANSFYREGLVNLINTQMMEYMGNQDNLYQASRIRQLKTNQEFVGILFRTFHENILNQFGFKPPGKLEQDRSVERPVARTQAHQPQAQAQRAQVGGSYKSIPQNPRVQESKIQERDHSASRRSSYSRATAPIKKDQPPADFDLSQYPAPHASSPLGKNLNKLIPPNQQTINFFTALFMESGEKISNQLITHAKIIFGTILRSVTQMLLRRSEFPPQKIVSQINLLQQAIKCRNIIRNVGQLLYHATNFALSQLVYEDQNKAMINQDLRSRNIDYKIDNFIKVINGVMLRVLENAPAQDTTGILFDLLNRQSHGEGYSQKTVYLIIKCISRVSGSYATDCRPDHVRDYFLKVNQYISTIDLGVQLEDFCPAGEKLKPEENMLKAIRSTLEDLCKLYKNGIWGMYDKAMSDARYPDNHIASFISSQGIPYPQKGRSVLNDEIKKINELLSKQKTFPAGIDRLKKYTEANHDFSPLEYFTSLNYDHKFITMVMNALEGNSHLGGSSGAAGNSFRKTPTKIDPRQDRSASRHQMPSSEGNIQDKIRKLKMKFQELQPREEEKPATGSRRGNNEDQSQERAMEIKRRIDEMKNKMTSGYQRQPH